MRSTIKSGGFHIESSNIFTKLLLVTSIILYLVNVWPNDNTRLSFSLGVSIVEDDDSGITMELELQWDGNPNIILDVRTLVGVSLPIQVTSYSLFDELLCI